MKYMYHLTTEESWEHIREEGLRPRCGRNSYLCCEDRNLVYVCDGESLPYWAALLDANVLLRVPEDGLQDLVQQKYSRYSEFFTTTPVEPSMLERIPMIEVPGDVQEYLCISYLEDISRLVARIIRHYRYGHPDQDMCAILSEEADLFLGIVSRLKYQECDPAKLVKWLRDEGDSGEYTLADTYENTSTRLWEQLLKFEDDDLVPTRRRLSAWIKENLPREARYARTGGYTTK